MFNFMKSKKNKQKGNDIQNVGSDTFLGHSSDDEDKTETQFASSVASDDEHPHSNFQVKRISQMAKHEKLNLLSDSPDWHPQALEVYYNFN